MAANDFTRRKFAWLDQIARDGEVPAEAFRLAYLLASDHLNRETGDAWPSQETLAAKLSLKSPRSIKHLIHALERQGHLAVTTGRGRGHSNRYAPILKGEAPEQDDLFSEPAEEPLDGAPESSFEEWWLQYPRKVGKGGARRIYDRIVSTGKASAEELAIGAMRYAAARSGQDPKYTKHPTTWLNQECWRDETLPPVQRDERPTATHGVSGTASAAAGLAAWLGGAETGDFT